MTKQYIAVKNLAYAYAETSLFSALSFALPQGRILQLTGKNGSGKTTLLQILAGLKTPQGGKIVRDEEMPLAYVGHQNALKLELSPLENLRLYQPSASLCREALESLELKKEFHEQPCYMLSAGQQRKVSLSRLLLSDARLWLVDEPFTSLDESAKACVTAHLEAHAKKGGSAIVATHEPLEIKSPFLEKVLLS